MPPDSSDSLLVYFLSIQKKQLSRLINETVVKEVFSLLSKSRSHEEWKIVDSGCSSDTLTFHCEEMKVIIRKSLIGDMSMLLLSQSLLCDSKKILLFRESIVNLISSEFLKFEMKFAVWCPKAESTEPHMATIECSTKPYFMWCSKHHDLEFNMSDSLFGWFPEVSYGFVMFCIEKVRQVIIYSL